MSKQNKPANSCANCDYVFPFGTIRNFCPDCGQRNIDRNVSVFDLLYDYVSNYFSFDSKLFRSFPVLLFKPGFLTQQFAVGKRQGYIKPLRLYLFASLIYFSVFSMITDNNSWFEDDTLSIKEKKAATKAVKSSVLDSTITNIKDTLDAKVFDDELLTEPETVFQLGKGRVVYQKDLKEFIQILDDDGEKALLDTLSKRQHFLAANWYFQVMTRQVSKIYLSRGKDFFNYFLGTIPLMMFLLMPFLAFIFKIFYLFSRQFYVKHLVFFFHFHAFMYLLLTAFLLIYHFWSGWIALLILFFSTLIYFWKAMVRVYQQHKFWTFLKYFVFWMIYPALLFCFLLLTLSSAFLLF